MFPSAFDCKFICFKQPRFPTTLEVVLHILWVRGLALGGGLGGTRGNPGASVLDVGDDGREVETSCIFPNF